MAFSYSDVSLKRVTIIVSVLRIPLNTDESDTSLPNIITPVLSVLSTISSKNIDNELTEIHKLYG
jgi:hypothetical protein